MKAQDLAFTELLEGSKQFIIPIFQRTYSWEHRHCEQLWEDIVRVGSHSDLPSHFIGSAVYIPDEDTSAAISRWLVIDGQQRITTIMLLLIAIRDRLRDENLENPVTAAYIDDSFLKNRHGKNEFHYRLLLTRTDKKSLIDLIDSKEPGDPVSQRIVENLQFFREKIAGADLALVYRGIRKLMIVDVRLQQGIDNPQMIFESMNSTGKALTQADLIRNFVLMGLEHDLQTRLYNDYWRPMEVEFGAENYNSDFDEFVRFFLVINAQNHRLRRQDVYDEFKNYSRNYDVEDLLISLKEFATYYCRIALGKEADNELAAVFHDIRELRADVCYPLLMEIYRDYHSGMLSKTDFADIARMVESYVFRRAVCDIPTNSLRQTFATFTQGTDKENYAEAVKAKFLLLPSYRRFPEDDEFIRQIKVRNLYKWNRRSYWLRRYENHNRKEHVPVQNYTIEHIMPQNENLSSEWRASLGDDWQRIHQEYLHTLGNLTLTGYNSEYSDRPFDQKRDMKGGFKESPLRLNEGLGSCETWNEEAIKARADKLAGKAVRIWTMLELPDDVLDNYRSKKPSTQIYTIADHPHLNDGITRELFEAFRAEVVALDECVTEEFLKLYIAYKAETNFVDVVPQAQRLRLTINLDFPEIDDPFGLCKDVSDIGRWGNGNVEFCVNQLSDVKYAVGLVRQALDKQLGDDATQD
jgi:uncharacterized protein with ParB-like and HNH nuclease domain/predicted transport protein